MAKENYQTVAFLDFSGGLATRREDNKIADNQSPDLKNIVFDGAGSFMPRYGTSAFGDASSASGKIRSTWTMVNINDIEVPLRQVDNTTISWLEYYNPQTTTWNVLDTPYTTGLNFGHADYDYFTYYCSQKDHQRRFLGICHTVSAAIGIGHTSCALSVSAASAIGFLSAGSLVVDGEEVYYLSATNKTFHTTAFTAAHTAYCGVAQLPTSGLEDPAHDGGWSTTSDNLPKGEIMLESDAQMFITGASGVSGNIIYYSKINEPTVYTISAAAGYGGTARYPEVAGNIKGLVDFDKILAVLKENTIRSFEFIQTGTDSGITELVDRQELATNPKVGAITHKSIAKVENDIFYTSPSGWIKSLSNTQDGRKTTEISLNIRPTVEGLIMTSSSGVYFDGKYYLACAASDSSINNIVLVYDYDYKAWTKFIGWNVSDWFIYQNNLYYGASNEIATYRALTGFDDNAGAYETYWSSKWFDFGIPHGQKRLREVYVEGYMTTNTSIGLSAYFDGKTGSPLTKSILGSGAYVDTADTITVIGGNTWGKGTFGGGSGTTSYTLKKFRVNAQFSGKYFYNMQIKIGTASPGFVYKITHIVPYLEKEAQVRINSNQYI